MEDGRTKNSGDNNRRYKLDHPARLKEILSDSSKAFHVMKYSVVKKKCSKKRSTHIQDEKGTSAQNSS